MGRERCFTNSAPVSSIREKQSPSVPRGTKTVTHVMTFQPKYGNQMGGGAILEAIGQTPRAITAFPRKVQQRRFQYHLHQRRWKVTKRKTGQAVTADTSQEPRGIWNRYAR